MKTTMALSACVALGAGTLATGTAWAQAAAESLVECTHVVDLSARLRCYDDRMTQLGHKVGPADTSTPAPAPAAQPPVRTAAASPPPVAAPLPTKAAQPVTQPSEFGMAANDVRKKREAEGVETPDAPHELIARVKSLGSRAHGEASIELENDQVWVETQHSGETFLEVGQTVTIRPGRLGSYVLTRDSGRPLRVKRIR